MLMNFLHHLFQTKVDCSVVSSDGYSPQNFTSCHWRERNQGFMAAHFIKPPVFLLFQFAVPIQIDSVVMKPKVGSQISTGIDLFVAGVMPERLESNVKTKRRKLPRKDKNLLDHQKQPEEVLPSSDKHQRKRRRIDLNSVPDNATVNGILKDEKPQDISTHNYSITVTTNSFRNEHRGLFSLVSRINEPSGNTIRVVNKRYNHCGNSMSDGVAEYDFFHVHTLNYVTHLVISIHRMKGSCVPSLGKLEIWGKPSPSCDKNIIDYALEIQKNIHQENVTDTCTHVNTKCQNDINAKEMDNSTDCEKIPPDFIDPITCKLMTIPMLLPSGLNIDITTLEKHTQAERQWGRKPSDPFTGVTFTNTIKPLPNSALKVRIDKYILSSGVDVSGFGRTVGRSLNNKRHANTICSLASRVDHSQKDQKYLKTNTFKESSDATTSMCTLHDSDKTENQDKQSPTDLTTQTHEERISNSLDSALMETLQGATFIRRKPSTSTNLSCSSLVNKNDTNILNTNLDSSTTSINQESKTCTTCKVALDSAFQLPCQHLMCRKCLLVKCNSTKQAVCSICQQPFHRKEVSRVHSM